MNSELSGKLYTEFDSEREDPEKHAGLVHPLTCVFPVETLK